MGENEDEAGSDAEMADVQAASPVKKEKKEKIVKPEDPKKRKAEEEAKESPAKKTKPEKKDKKNRNYETIEDVKKAIIANPGGKPKKEEKFGNWVKNTMKCSNEDWIKDLWTWHKTENSL